MIRSSIEPRTMLPNHKTEMRHRQKSECRFQRFCGTCPARFPTANTSRKDSHRMCRAACIRARLLRAGPPIGSPAAVPTRFSARKRSGRGRGSTELPGQKEQTSPRGRCRPAPSARCRPEPRDGHCTNPIRPPFETQIGANSGIGADFPQDRRSSSEMPPIGRDLVAPHPPSWALA